ncbi:MAG: PEP-CTERM sorting domain-containing protein [Candidatus Omnitrophota bacterium]
MNIRGMAVAVFLIAAMILGSHAAEASVLDFETGSQSGETVIFNNQGYGGFTWDENFYFINESGFYGNDPINFPSYDHAVYNGNGILVSTVTRSSNFDFIGASFIPWLSQNQIYDYSSTTITMKGYNGSDLVGEVTHSLTDSFVYCAANFSGIDRLEFIATENPAPHAPLYENERWWLMDDFTYTAYDTGGDVVPEPATMALFGIGGAVAAFIRKKKRV